MLRCTKVVDPGAAPLKRGGSPLKVPALELLQQSDCMTGATSCLLDLSGRFEVAVVLSNGSFLGVRLARANLKISLAGGQENPGYLARAIMQRLVDRSEHYYLHQPYKSSGHRVIHPARLTWAAVTNAGNIEVPVSQFRLESLIPRAGNRFLYTLTPNPDDSGQTAPAAELARLTES